MSLKFVLPGLLDGFSVDPNDVRVMPRPTIFAPVVVTGNAPPSSPDDYSYRPVLPSLISVTGSSHEVEALFR